MTPLPEICKECRHHVLVPIGGDDDFTISAKRCFVWNRVMGDNDSCQFFESRENIDLPKDWGKIPAMKDGAFRPLTKNDLPGYSPKQWYSILKDYEALPPIH